jgi:quercetin dioxygenase-like cupin family protein
MYCSRRDLCFLLPALWSAAPGFLASGAVLPAQAYPFGELPTRREGENVFRPVLEGETHSGYDIELHETELAPGGRPHPPHRHVHEEIFLIRQGELDVMIAGKTTRLGPGSVAYIASNVEHGIHNAGRGAAEYFVLALGSDRA